MLKIASRTSLLKQYIQTIQKVGTSLIFGCGLSLISATAHAECPLPIKVGYEHYPPYQIAPNGKIESGYDYDVIEAIGQKMGCKIEWVPRPWKRLLNDLEAGRIHLTSSALINFERQEFAYFSPAYRIAERVLFVRKDIESNNLKEFLESSHRLGLVSGYIYNEILDQNDNDLAPLIEYANSTNLTIPKIKNNRIDGTIEEKAVFKYYLKQHNAESLIRETEETLQTTPMHMMVSRKGVSKTIAARIFEAIKSLSQEGYLKEVALKYKE